jgi:hypothetical protein
MRNYLILKFHNCWGSLWEAINKNKIFWLQHTACMFPRFTKTNFKARNHFYTGRYNLLFDMQRQA